MWRHALAFVGAYLLVLQAAFAGLESQHMQAAQQDLAAQVICQNGQASVPDADKPMPSPFDCCGVGCTVGLQSLHSPSSPEQALSYPADREFEVDRAAAGTVGPVSAAEGPSPRGPPAAI
jgi:hypothetical protein